MALVNNATFAPHAMATYFASLVKIFKQCLVILLAFPTMPPTITATSDTQCLSLSLLAYPRRHTRKAFGHHPLRTPILGLSSNLDTRLCSSQLASIFQQDRGLNVLLP